jgi:hypothetical protein
MVPPLDVILEVSNQLLRCREHVGAFLATEMPVIALADFIIIPRRSSIFSLLRPLCHSIMRLLIVYCIPVPLTG